MSNNDKELRYLPARELRASTNADGSKNLSGYAIVYSSESTDLGGFVEIVAPGAVTESLANNPDVLMLRDHNPELLMGRTTSGTLTLTEDSIGVRFVCKLPQTTAAADLAISIERGDISGCSFGFVTLEDQWANSGDKLVRNLLRIKLLEISVVSFPAYSATSVAVRSKVESLRSVSNSAASEEAARRFRRYMQLRMMSLTPRRSR